MKANPSKPYQCQYAKGNCGDLEASRARGTRRPRRLPPPKGALWPLPVHEKILYVPSLVFRESLIEQLQISIEVVSLNVSRGG
jgi:hypothetical protein